jgi:hypothetical protein
VLFRSLNTVREEQPILLFGAGAGSLLTQTRRIMPTTEIHVWDRDPAVLRALLSSVEVTQEVADGSIQFHMGADFLELLKKRNQFLFMAHPLLGQVYSAEALLWELGVGDKVACVCTGGLLVPDLEDALRARGYSILPVDLVHVSQHEIDYGLRTIRPQLIAAINYVTGMESVAHRHDIPFLCWDMDPTTDRLAKAEGDNSQLFVFSCRPRLVESFKAQGFENVTHLPLATNPERRRPLTLTPEEFDRYGAHVSFVGATLITEAVQFQTNFINVYGTWLGTEDGKTQAKQVLDQVLAVQREDLSVYRIPELMQQYMPGFIRFIASQDETLDPCRWVAEIAAMEKRLSIMANLGRFKPAVWGDTGWLSVEEYGVRYMGQAGHMEELTDRKSVV